jgi:DNA-binding SARP family transcriptional activator/tetratricopeptide (TPR) repeat protein
LNERGNVVPRKSVGNRSLSVRLLGEIRVLRDGDPVVLPASKKTRALLGYLVTARTPQPRQRLCDLLWDGPDDPRAALRWSLTKLRPVVDDGRTVRLVADRDRVGFEALGATVDLFEASAHVGRDVSSASTDALLGAAGALDGDFLEGLDLPDCYRFHEWCTAERERSRALRLAVLDALVERLESASPEEALRHARQRLSIDPLSDTAHATAVRLLARLGRNGEAQAQVETCRRILERELGGRRSTALELARMEIGKTAPVERAPAARPASEPLPEPKRSTAVKGPRSAFVARAAERAILEDLLRRATEGRANEVLLLSGEPGIGKSRLLGELEALTAAQGGTLLAGRAFEAEAVRPFGIWIDTLRGAPLAGLDADLRGHLAPLFPELGEARNDPESKARLFDGVARLLRTLSVHAPVVLAVDDLHWLDEASAGLLHYVARVSLDARVAIVCAARDGELEDNAGALRFVRGLRRDGRLRNLPISPLREEETGALVHAAVGQGVDATRVFCESGGNPLFAIEVARALAGGAREGPQPLEGLLEERLARLGTRARDLVPWAAALGREFEPEVLAVVSGETLAHTAGVVGELEQEGLVSGSGVRYVFTHELVRQAAYRHISGARRRLVHLAIARALASSPDPGVAWGDVVHHASLADDPALVAKACVAAANRAHRMLARRQARDFAVRGLAQVARLGADALEVRVELLEIAALSAGMDTARQAALEDDAEAAAKVARETGRSDLAAKALFALGFFRHARGDLEGAHRVMLGSAEASRASSPAESVPVIANTAFCLAIIERELPKARALLDEAAEGARIHHLSVIDIDLGEGYLAHMEGDVVRAKGALERGLALARSGADSWRQSMALIRLAMIELESGDWDAARTRAEELRAVAMKLGEGSEGAIADALDALAVRGMGGPEGVAKVAAAIEGLVRADAKAMLAYVLTSAAEMAIEDGAFADGEKLARLALDAAEPLGKPSAIILARASLGRSLLGAGDRATALAHLQAARTLIDHPYGISRRTREAVERLVAVSNAGTNAPIHAGAARKRRR